MIQAFAYRDLCLDHTRAWSEPDMPIMRARARSLRPHRSQRGFRSWGGVCLFVSRSQTSQLVSVPPSCLMALRSSPYRSGSSPTCHIDPNPCPRLFSLNARVTSCSLTESAEPLAHALVSVKPMARRGSDLCGSRRGAAKMASIIAMSGALAPPHPSR